MSDEEGQKLWLEVEEPINKTMVWAGAVANLPAWEPHLWLAVDFDPPWYHCRKCLKRDVPRHKARLSLSAKFCPQCGTKLRWPVE